MRRERRERDERERERERDLYFWDEIASCCADLSDLNVETTKAKNERENILRERERERERDRAHFSLYGAMWSYNPSQLNRMTSA